jgi:foldase protein PrsA
MDKGSKLGEDDESLKKLNTGIFVLILCLAFNAGVFTISAQEENEAIVARVNGVEITRAQFHENLERNYGRYALQEMIVDELIKQKQASVDAEINEEEFTEIYALVVAQLGGPQGLQMFLAQNGITEQQLVDQIRWNMTVNLLAMSEVEASEEDVAKWFDEHREYYDQPETVEVSHILVENAEDSLEIIRLLREGADFSELAAEKSIDPGSANQGGKLGRIARGVTVPEFEEKAFSLPVGEYGLTESSFGWHVILVTDRTEAEEAILSEIYQMVENDYRSSKALDVKSYLAKLEAEADIEILFEQP